jgi:hypothetical protein
MSLFEAWRGFLIHSEESFDAVAVLCETRARCVGWGAVAQLGERLVRNEEVSGSIPLSSTKDDIGSAEPNWFGLFCVCSDRGLVFEAF